ncbi:coenzyme F420-0:L-glutamate ligase [Nocardioides aquaticus]|uniref:coenzyme F420-0:L-glutamate ligase n=1 Tax=Nocardioides aquaticus TaxID=160826 RepID=UPI0031D5F33D
MTPGGSLRVHAPDGTPEVAAGDDLLGLVLTVLGDAGLDLADGDVLVVTSKAVAKAEGRVVDGTREEHLDAETARLVARRGPTRIVRTHHGLTLAAAGIDASNVATGRVVLLPVDPDATAGRLREEVLARTGRTVGVVVTDTAGRAWREGQTDIAVGAAGLVVLDDHAGRVDAHGNPLLVTAPAVADEVAGAAERAQGKLHARPFAVVRGRADLVLAADDDGPGARALVRPEGADLFGWGAREAVVRAVRGDVEDAAPFGSAAAVEDLVTALGVALGDGAAVRPAGPGLLHLDLDPGGGHHPAREGGMHAVVFAHGWVADRAAGSSTYALRPRSAGPPAGP